MATPVMAAYLASVLVGPADRRTFHSPTTRPRSNRPSLRRRLQGNYIVYGVGGNLTFTLPFGALKPMFQFVKHKIDIDNTTLLDPERTDFLVGLVASFGATMFALRSITTTSSTRLL